jgi:hypothetical protein
MASAPTGPFWSSTAPAGDASPSRPGGNSIRGLVEDADGRIWVASLSTFGYLSPNEAGDLE